MASPKDTGKSVRSAHAAPAAPGAVVVPKKCTSRQAQAVSVASVAYQSASNNIAVGHAMCRPVRMTDIGHGQVGDKTLSGIIQSSYLNLLDASSNLDITFAQLGMYPTAPYYTLVMNMDAVSDVPVANLEEYPVLNAIMNMSAELRDPMPLKYTVCTMGRAVVNAVECLIYNAETGRAEFNEMDSSEDLECAAPSSNQIMATHTTFSHSLHYMATASIARLNATNYRVNRIRSALIPSGPVEAATDSKALGPTCNLQEDISLRETLDSLVATQALLHENITMLNIEIRDNYLSL
ncbi:hypothetical protein fHeYen902_298 [Yersinia phage fHe-Yen9-02]|nr:hypothetical protein fHeYen902_298 [Yersinia phage fHe-Yen9-02]